MTARRYGCEACETLLVCPRHGSPPAPDAHDRRREELRDSVLCQEHADYYELGPREVQIAAAPASPDDPIECELCSLAAMRAAGVL